MSPRVEVKPEEDARLPILEAEIEREWRQHRKAFVRELINQNYLQKAIKNTALSCVRVLQEYEAAGHNPDQGREAMRELIFPRQDQ